MLRRHRERRCRVLNQRIKWYRLLNNTHPCERYVAKIKALNQLLKAEQNALKEVE